jgi:hypothetical protein
MTFKNFMLSWWGGTFVAVMIAVSTDTKWLAIASVVWFWGCFIYVIITDFRSGGSGGPPDGGMDGSNW